MATMAPLSSPQILSTSNYASYFTPPKKSNHFVSVFQQMLSTSCRTAAYLMAYTLYASLFLGLHCCQSAAMLVKELWIRGSEMARQGWAASEPLRQKLFFEFMVFVLGGGYGILLILLWPGWIVIGAFALGFCLMKA